MARHHGNNNPYYGGRGNYSRGGRGQGTFGAPSGPAPISNPQVRNGNAAAAATWDPPSLSQPAPAQPLAVSTSYRASITRLAPTGQAQTAQIGTSKAQSSTKASAISSGPPSQVSTATCFNTGIGAGQEPMVELSGTLHSSSPSLPNPATALGDGTATSTQEAGLLPQPSVTTTVITPDASTCAVPAGAATNSRTPAFITAEALLARMNATYSVDLTTEDDRSHPRNLTLGCSSFRIVVASDVLRRLPKSTNVDVNRQVKDKPDSDSACSIDGSPSRTLTNELKAAAVVVLSIAHGRFENVPSRASSSLVYEIVGFAQRKAILHLLRPYARGWAESLGQKFQTGLKNPTWGENCNFKLVRIFWELGAPKLFAKAIRNLALTSSRVDGVLMDDDSNALDTSKLPPGAYDQIIDIRTGTLTKAAAELNATLTNLKGLVPSCCHGDTSCDIMYFGALMRALEINSLHPLPLEGSSGSLFSVSNSLKRATAEVARNIRFCGFKVAAQKTTEQQVTAQKSLEAMRSFAQLHGGCFKRTGVSAVGVSMTDLTVTLTEEQKHHFRERSKITTCLGDEEDC